MDGVSWYRFDLETGENGVMDECRDRETCGTYTPIWINASHPTEFGIIKDVTMAGSWSGNCFRFTGSASVTKCSVDRKVFYLYKLWKPTGCFYSYCTKTYMFGKN